MTETKKRNMNPNSIANLKPIPKGTILNPLGAGAHDPIKKAIRKLTAPGWEIILNTVVMGTLEDLKNLAEDKKLPAIQAGVARTMYKAAAAGDWTVLKDMVHTLLGKPDFSIQMKGAIVHTTLEELSEIQKEEELIDARIRKLNSGRTGDKEEIIEVEAKEIGVDPGVSK